MQAGRSIALINPYDWLPTYGESGVDVRSDTGTDWTVDVTYDGAEGQLLRRALRFKNVSSLHVSAVPGAEVLNIDYAERPPADANLGSLWEYPESQAAAAWTKHW